MRTVIDLCIAGKICSLMNIDYIKRRAIVQICKKYVNFTLAESTVVLSQRLIVTYNGLRLVSVLLVFGREFVITYVE